MKTSFLKVALIYTAFATIMAAGVNDFFQIYSLKQDLKQAEETADRKTRLLESSEALRRNERELYRHRLEAIERSCREDIFDDSAGITGVHICPSGTDLLPAYQRYD